MRFTACSKCTVPLTDSPWRTQTALIVILRMFLIARDLDGWTIRDGLRDYARIKRFNCWITPNQNQKNCWRAVCAIDIYVYRWYVFLCRRSISNDKIASNEPIAGIRCRCSDKQSGFRNNISPVTLEWRKRRGNDGGLSFLYSSFVENETAILPSTFRGFFQIVSSYLFLYSVHG